MDWYLSGVGEMGEMTETRALTVSLILTLLPFGLILWGAREGIAVLWWAGIALFVIGGAIPSIARYVFEDDEESEEEVNGVDEEETK